MVFTAGIGEHSPKVRARVCEVFPAPPTAFLSSPNRIFILPQPHFYPPPTAFLSSRVRVCEVFPAPTPARAPFASPRAALLCAAAFLTHRRATKELFTIVEN